MEARRLDILYAVEHLLPATGGAERHALDWLGALARRHTIRATWLEGGSDAPAPGEAPGKLPAGVEGVAVAAPDADGGYWARKRARRERLGTAVARELARRPADVVVTALHAAPGAIAAAGEVGAASVLVLHSYESLCKYAFDAGSECRPRSGCRACPRALALDPDERRELIAARAAHGEALAAVACVVAPSRAVAEACRAWSGREAAIVPDVAGVEPERGPDSRGAAAREVGRHAEPGADGAGRILLAAARWSPNKGAGLLAPLARALAPRPLAITARGLPAELRAELQELRHVDVVANAPIRHLLAAASVLLVPSQWPEPFGRLAFEGLAAGVPTLASAVGGLREYVPGPQLVDPPGSVAAWAGAVRALDDPEHRRAARRAGIRAARQVVAVPPADRLETVLRAAVSG